jgi:DNA invertase Pin-like site-specific DNA recombinase
MAKNTIKAAAIYCRLSQDRNGNSLGIDRQEQLCRELAEQRDWTIAEVYVDRDVSAYSGKRRPRYQQMLDDVKNRRHDAVIVVDQDRLTRTPRELEDIIDLAEMCGTALATVQGDIDLSTSEGRALARIMGTMARQESEKKSERQQRQRKQAAQLGKYQGGRRPYGYESDGVTVQESEAKLIREAARRIIAGEAVRTIAIDWNDRGIPTSSGKRWLVTSIRTMMTGPRLAGLRVHHGEVVGDAEWPAILDRKTYERVRAILGDPRRHQPGRPAAHLLAGLLRCAKCGAKMNSGRRPNGDRRYMCPPEPSGCGRTAITADALEELIVDAVLNRIDNPKMSRQLAKPKRKKDDATVDLEQIERDLDLLAKRFGEGKITQRQWINASEPLERRRDDAVRSITAIVDTAALEPFRGHDVRRAWARADLDRRRTVLKALIDTITIGPGKPGRHGLDPDRVAVAWRI